MKNKLTFWALLIFVSASISFAQTTYYVSTTGNDITGDGSFLTPWATIQHANNSAAPNDIIRVMPGGYNITGSPSPGAALDIDRALTIVAYDWVFSGNNTTTTLVGIDVKAIDIRITAANVTIQGFTIDFDGAGARAIGAIEINGNPNLQNVHILNNIIYLPDGDPNFTFGEYGFRTGGPNDCNGLQINNNTFYANGTNGGFGIYLNPATGITSVQVNGNTFSGKVLQGIIDDGISNVTIDGNTLNTSLTTGLGDNPKLIQITNWSANAISTISVTNNFLGIGGANQGGDYSIILKNPGAGSVSGVTVSGNTINNATTAGIRQQDVVTGVTYSGNTISSNPIGLEIVSGTVTSITNNDITNNTADGIKISGTATVGSINNNNFAGNTSYGINNTTGVDVNAENNWWGSSIGPFHATNNTSGTGDAVSDNVDYNPWTIYTVAPPMLNNPINGLTGVSVLPTLEWDDTDETTFLVKISTDGTSQFAFNNNVVVTKQENQDVLTYPTLATDTGLPLNNGTTYYWQVLVQGGANDGYVSEIYHFTTTPAMTVSLSTPTNGGTIYSSPASFSWYLSTSTSGLKFIVQYKYAAAPPTNAENETFWSGGAFTSLSSTTSLSTTGTVLYGKTYYWRVLVQRTSNSEYVYYPMADVYSTFTTAGGSSVTVTPSWPLGGATVYTNSPTLYWYLDQYATGLTYEIKYSTNSGTSGGVLNVSVTDVSTGSSNLYYTIGPLTPGTTYYWQVRASYAAGSSYSAWTTPESFVTNGSGTVQVPIPSYPTGGVTVYTTSPTIYWYLNTAATGLYYDIEIDLLANVLTGGIDYSTGSTDVLYKQVTGLTPGATYHYKIKSRNGDGVSSSWSSEATFVVAGGTTASYAVASYPIGNPTVYTNTPTLYWYLEGSGLGISSYIVKYKKTSAPANWTLALGGPNSVNDGQYTGLSTSTFSQQIITPLTYGATYYWAVYATGTANPINALSVGSFTVVGGSTATTIALSTPSDGSTVYSTSATLYWYVNGSSTGIVDYTVRFSQSDVFASFTDYTVTAPTTYKALSALTNGATYYWKVKGNYADGSSTGSNDFTSPFSFTVNTGSPSVVQPLVGGPNNVTVNTSAPTLSWVLPAKTAANSTYEVQLAENPNFQSAKTFSSSKSNMQVSGLVGGKSYFWKVRSRDGTGNTSYYSGTGQFKVNSSVTAVEEKEVIPTQFELSQNYPNPFNPSTRIAYALPQNSYVSIKVYDMLGREVKALVNNEMSAGNHSVDWNGDGNNGTKAASGTYVYRITAGNFVAVKKMILIK